ncbi:MAG: EamA family transporter [Actinomycetota bacterium]|nr:EamA family transporter [Actinomycetota bacterium]
MALEVPPPDALPEAIQAASSPAASRLASLGLLVVSITFAVAGQLTLKSAMDSVGRIGRADLNSLGQTVLRAAKEPRLWTGLFLFGISAMFWLVVLSRVRLSVAYPLVGISYILIVALARFVLHEHVPPLRWVGVVIIAIGIAVIGFSFRRTTGV